MIIKVTALNEYLGFLPEQNETVLIDGNYWIIDHYYEGDCYLVEATAETY